MVILAGGYCGKIVNTKDEHVASMISIANQAFNFQSGVIAIVTIVILKETFPPVILQRSAGNRIYGTEQVRRRRTFWAAIARPTKLMMRSPIVGLASLNISIAYVYFYFFMTTFPNLFGGQYGFDAGEIGLTYIGPAVGSILGSFTAGPFSDWYLSRQRISREDGTSKPEDRLCTLLPGNILIGIGMLWYGWAASASLHWILPLVGASIATLGITGVFMAIQTYLTDSFGLYAASAIAVNTVIRSILGAVLPLAAPALYRRLGYGWGSSLLGFLAFAFLPITLLLSRFGERLRTNPKFQVL